MLSTLFRRRRGVHDSGGEAGRRRASGGAEPPPISAEERNGNLSELEKSLNAQMKCPAGKNQVFIRSVVSSGGTTPPRIALRCTFRRDLGMTPEVYYEHVRDVCTCDPEKCDAYRQMRKRLDDL